MPLDNQSWQPAVSQGPWTHQPRCATDTADPNAKLCVFTDATRGPNGLGLITTPEQAAQAAAVFRLPAVSLAPGKLETVAFEVVDIPGKGKGVVAKRHIPAHQSITIDQPVLLIDNIHGKTINAGLTAEMRTRAVEQLARPEAVLALSALKNSRENIVNNIFRANSFELGLGETKYGALYPGISVSPVSITRKPKPNNKTHH